MNVIHLGKQKRKNMETLNLNSRIKGQKFSWGKDGNDVSGWIKFMDGTRTHFTISEGGEWYYTGEQNENVSETISFIEGLKNFLQSGE